MTRENLSNQYFEWLCIIVSNSSHIWRSYTRLFEMLHNTDFQVLIDMDENRAIDGIDLRYRFGDECGYGQSMIATYIDIYPCSVLEMIVALALRCEENIMDDPEKGNRISKWFWIMLENLGLEPMNNDIYDEKTCKQIVHRFLDRKYSRDGEGGLFIIRNCKYDLRQVEIWHQMCWYLDSILDI
ncbi:MAG: hypothetical protein LUD27_02755 [Clostridia bacterium]|nr:hypothetical protein [Clostridia bacterium]